MTQNVFSSTVRNTALIEDKVKIQSLNSMEVLNRAYLMNTQRSPEKLVFNKTIQKTPQNPKTPKPQNPLHRFCLILNKIDECPCCLITHKFWKKSDLNSDY